MDFCEIQNFLRFLKLKGKNILPLHFTKIIRFNIGSEKWMKLSLKNTIRTFG